MDNSYILDYTDEQEIKDLLLYRKITKINDDTLLLDNGIELQIIPNIGCCGSGEYYLEELNEVDNTITNVWFTCEYVEEQFSTTAFKIFVLAENKKILLANIQGNDGNGYYGSGYTIQVKLTNK